MSGEKKPEKKRETRWASVLWYIHLHVLGLLAIWLVFTSAKWMTVIYTAVLTAVSCLGLTVGAHRLWAHKSFSAVSSLRLFLMLAHTVAGVGPIYDWVLYHKLHHKYYGTDKDPYNHKKGFLYSHYMGNCMSPTVDYEQAKQEVDTRDIELDRFVWIQKQFYWPMFLVFGIILPLNVPLAYWDESMTETILIAGLLRFAIATNVCWLVNSAWLIWNIKGNKFPPDSISVFLIKQSFWPSYHYKVPWDWKCGEFGSYGNGCGSFFIKIWYELEMVSNLQSNNCEDIRKMLHEVSTKKISLNNGLEQLKEMSIFNASAEKLLISY